MLSNLTFSPLELIEIDKPCTPEYKLKTQARIPPKMSEYIFSLDMSQDNKSWIRFKFYDLLNEQMISTTIDKFFKSEFGFYDDVSEDAKPLANEKGDQVIEDRSKPNIKGVKFMRYATDEEYNNNEKADGTPLEIMQVHMETVRKIYTDIKDYGENFQFRERVFDRSNAVKIMMYPRYVLVNKTKKNVIIEGQVIKSLQNDYLMTDFSKHKPVNGRREYKIKLEVDGFEKSDFINLAQVGTNGVITLDSKDKHEQLQFGVSISFGPVPFNKTTIITVVPRHVIVNKLECPILIRQQCGDLDKKTNKTRVFKYIKVDFRSSNFQENLHLNFGKITNNFNVSQQIIENKI